MGARRSCRGRRLLTESLFLTNIHPNPKPDFTQRMCDESQAKLPGAPPPLEVPPFMYGAPVVCGETE